MNNNKKSISIDGTTIAVTADQLATIRRVVESFGISPFSRQPEGSQYYVIGSREVIKQTESGDSLDDESYDIANYFSSEAFANQVALHQDLYRRLLRFSYENNSKDTSWETWDGCNCHYHIYLDGNSHAFKVGHDYTNKRSLVYFADLETANRAIDEVVLPFIQSYPEFRW